MHQSRDTTKLSDTSPNLSINFCNIHPNGLTTTRYDERWIIFNPGSKENALRISYEGIVKLYERCWWCGMDLPAHLTAIDDSPTYVISEEQAIEASIKLKEKYPYLANVCLILGNGLTFIQSVD